MVLMTGEKSGVIVCDLDINGKGNGVNSFLEFMGLESLEQLDTPYAKTGSGGYHIYYKI